MERLVEAIKEGEIVRVPESQAREEELFILRTFPISEEVKEEKVEKGRTIDFTDKYKKPGMRDVPRVETWRKKSYQRNNVLISLKDNFHWDISKTRISKGLSRKQLAEAIGETEDKLRIIENGGLPDDNFSLINKIENKLGINLRKDKVVESVVTLAELQKMDERRVKIELERAQGSQADEVDDNMFGNDIEVID
ncbi:hypothetical protein AUJ84_00660 [Candidatus Pacearchaeota archaeon CG1_02_32_132]|nr:MAG: hypothetical protein AUJ84_00660 [Candidatus Pacearchaeota archaeon CG1_02_32_132]